MTDTEQRFDPATATPEQAMAFIHEQDAFLAMREARNILADPTVTNVKLMLYPDLSATCTISGKNGATGHYHSSGSVGRAVSIAREEYQKFRVE